jgi:hypothetical protein
MANTDTEGNGAKRTHRKGFTKVQMLDQNGDVILTAKGEPSDDPTEARAFDITVGGSTLRCEPFSYNEKIRNGLVIFGAKQRFTNAIGGLEETEAFEKLSQIHEAMLEGEEWARTGTGPRLVTLTEAIVRIKKAAGQDADFDEIKGKLRAKPADELKELSGQPTVVATMEEIKAEKAQERAHAARERAGTGASDFASFNI